MKKKNIVLVGFRGCGKKEFGLALSQLTGIPFADIDTEVEFIINDRIDHFVEEHGWQVYREIEQKVAHDFCRNFSGIIATGSGTIENSKNLENLKKTGVFVFTNPSFDDVRKKLLTTEKEDTRERMNPDIPFAQEIDQMWAQRKGIYQAISDVEINYNLHGDFSEEAKALLPQLKKILPKAPKQQNIALIDSLNGQLFDGLLESQKKGRIPNVTFSLLLAQDKDSPSIAKAEKENIPVHIIETDKNNTAEERDRSFINVLRQKNPDCILLDDVKNNFSSLYKEQFGNITIQAHPSLLLSTLSKKTPNEIHEHILEQEERYTGCTLHKFSHSNQEPESILQRKILIDEYDTVETLSDRIQKQEILGFCEVLEKTT